MPFCPKCRYEYNIGVSVCPDCNETLVDRLPEKTELESDKLKDWVCIGQLTSQAYADMIEEAFQEKNIPVVVLSGSGHFGMTGQMGTSSTWPIKGGYSIMVPDDFVEDADHEAEIIFGDDWPKYKI